MSETAQVQPDIYYDSVRDDNPCPKCGGALFNESGPPDFTPELACLNCGNIIYDTTLDRDRAAEETSGPRAKRQPNLPHQPKQHPGEKAQRLREIRQSEIGYHKKPGGPPKRRDKGGQWTPKS